MQGQRIAKIEEGSIAEELGLLPGDIILSINNQPIKDVLDYRFLCMDEFLELEIARGEESGIFEVEKDYEDELGISFEDGLMDSYRSCRNKCVFCFIDQMPPGMRETLYFKDDDDRLSFLQGNYITLTNLSDDEVDRIIRYRLSPINISIHTMNPELRCKMLNNRFAGESLKILDKLYDAGISMNGQIVLCEGINDGEELESSIKALGKYAPVMESVSVVPVGLTKFRDKLAKLSPISKENAARTIDIIEKYQRECYEKYGLHFIHASDEFYLMTGRALPEAERYDGYLQFENGVGMLRQMSDSFYKALKAETPSDREDDITIATGLLAAPFLKELISDFNKSFPNIRVNVHPVTNKFFGEQITVAGLITGQDLIESLKSAPHADKLYISENMLRSGETVFLDDVSCKDVERELKVKVYTCASDGESLLCALLGNPDIPGQNHGEYEL